MPTHARVSLAEAVRRLSLLEPRRQADLPLLQARFPQSRALAGELIRRDWLTPFQVNQLFRGKGHELILGPYLILERLGEGGMGRVFKAVHRKMGRVAALKVIRQEHLSNARAVRRFYREIRAAARLDHPNVVHAYDAGSAGRTHYIVMEYVEGLDLHRTVERGGPLPVGLACDYARQAALGLQHAHECGLIHRDVKPHNLMATPAGRVKVLDVGLVRPAEALGDEGLALTRPGVVLGSVDYVAPEQAEDPGAADARSDLYGLGCTLYYLLAGRPPFAGGSVVERLLRHRRQEAPPLSQARPDAPPAVGAVVRRLMAKQPGDRYATAADASAALAALPPAREGVLGPPVGRVGDDTLAEAAD